MKKLIVVIFILNVFYSLAQSRKDSLFIFVGKQISLTRLTRTDTIDSVSTPGVKKWRIFMDAAYKAKYEVVTNLFNKINTDTIEFEAYDHYGIPAFSKYDYVLLFVSNINGKLYHEKYQYYDVYKTIDGRWASPGDPYRFDQNLERKIEAVNITFEHALIFDIPQPGFRIRVPDYKPPYYRVTGNKAIAIMGNYIEELFKIKKDGVLKARGIFN